MFVVNILWFSYPWARIIPYLYGYITLFVSKIAVIIGIPNSNAYILKLLSVFVFLCCMADTFKGVNLYSTIFPN